MVKSSKGAPLGLTSAQALAEVSRLLGVPLSQRDLDNAVRALPCTSAPPVVRGRRRWAPEHLEAVRALLAARRGSEVA